MDIANDDTVLLLWTARLDPSKFDSRPGDFLALLVATADGRLKGEWRFRYSAGPGFNDDDEINRYSIEAEDKPVVRLKIESIFRGIMQTGPFLDRFEQRINGPGSALMDALSKHPNFALKIRPL